MNFDLSENQQLLRQGAERFLRDRYDFESRRQRLAAASGTDRAMWAQFAKLGWTAVLVPERVGGLGWHLQDAALLLIELGKVLATEPLLDAAIVAVALLDGAPAPAGDALLSAIAAGEALVVPALLEPGRRYAYQAPQTRAERVAGGFRLSGGKILAAGGDAADHILLSAMLDGALALFAIPAQTPGLARTGYATLNGGFAADFVLDCVQVDEAALLGAGPAAAAVLDRALDMGAVGVAALAVGGMEQVIAITNEYLHTRHQFGQALSAFQALQHRMADMFIEVGMARSALLGALSAFDGVPKARQAAVSGARGRADRAGLTIANAGIHLHGGMGMTIEYPVGHYYRQLVQITRSYGDTGYHLERYEQLLLEPA